MRILLYWNKPISTWTTIYFDFSKFFIWNLFECQHFLPPCTPYHACTIGHILFQFKDVINAHIFVLEQTNQYLNYYLFRFFKVFFLKFFRMSTFLTPYHACTIRHILYQFEDVINAHILVLEKIKKYDNNHLFWCFKVFFLIFFSSVDISDPTVPPTMHVR
jgi:hypothetical protein